MLRTIILAACLLLPFVPAGTAAEEAPELPAWLAPLLAERGVDPADPGLRVVRTVTENGAITRFEVPLDALPSEDPFGGRTVATPSVPDVLVGELTLHAMLQFSCAGYGAQEAAPGVDLVQGASWDIGVHAAVGPLAGGVAASTGGDPVANLLAIVGADTGMELAVGDMAVQEDRLMFWGSCLLLIGQMNGLGAWHFT